MNFPAAGLVSDNRRQSPPMLRTLPWFFALSCLLHAGFATAQTPPPTPAEPSAERQARLIRMVRQDCGSCHGIQLTGGLGPALTRELMAEIPHDTLFAVIYNGRPGTAMPGWKTMLSEADAHWIARQLQQGFPAESTTK